MAQAFPPLSTHATGLRSFGTTEFEPLLDSEEAARLLRIHLPFPMRAGYLKDSQPLP